MTTPQAQFSNPKIPTYLPLSEAAQKYGLSEKALTQLKIFRKLRRHRVPGMVEMATRPENVHHMDLGSDDQPGNYSPFR